MKKLTKALLGVLIGATAACSVAAIAACDMVHVHDWADDFTVDRAATCTENGSKSIHCKGCNETKETTVIEATGHVWATEYTVDLDATCTEAGSKSYHCTVEGCNGTNEAVAIEATGHVWATEYTVDAQPTCTEVGSKSYHCTVEGCNGMNDPAEIPANGHVLADEYTVDIAPTCIEVGSKSKHCTVEGCDGTGESVEILATGHVATEYEATASTCAVNGHDAYWYCETCENYFSNADCTSAIDAPVEYPLTEHTYDWSDSRRVSQPATCTEDGYQEHYVCTVCEAKFASTDGTKLLEPIYDMDWVTSYVIPAAHTNVTKRTVKDATCTADGYSQEHYYCTACKSSAWDQAFTQPMTSEEAAAATVTKLGHDYSEEFTVDKEATCSVAGSESRHCSRCTSKTGTRTIAKIDHAWDESEYVVDVAATCQAKGSKSYHCSVCGATNADSAVEIDIAPDAHDWSARSFALTRSTCMAEGTQAKYCMLCGDQQAPTTAPVDPAAHSFADEWTVDVEPTCTTSGSKSLHCTVEGCDGKGNVTQIPALGHKYEWHFEGLNGTEICAHGCGATGSTYTLPAEAAGKTVNNVVEANASSGHYPVCTGSNYVAVTLTSARYICYLEFVAKKSGVYLFEFEYSADAVQANANAALALKKGDTVVTGNATIVKTGDNKRVTSAKISVLAGETLTLQFSVGANNTSYVIMTASLETEMADKSLAYGNNTVNVTVANNNTGVDSYTFTPDETRKYAMTVPEGLSVAMNDKVFISDGTYAEFDATAGKEIVFSFTHSTVGEYTAKIGELQPKVLELGVAVTPTLKGHSLVGYKVADGVAPGKYTITFTGSFLRVRQYPYGHIWLQVNGSGDYNDMTDDNALYIESGATTDKPGYALNCSTVTSWTVTLELTAGDMIYLTLDKAFGESYTVNSASVLSMTLTQAA